MNTVDLTVARALWWASWAGVALALVLAIAIAAAALVASLHAETDDVPPMARALVYGGVR